MLFMVVVSVFTPKPTAEQVEFITFTGDYKTLIKQSWNKWDVVASLGVVLLCTLFYIYFGKPFLRNYYKKNYMENLKKLEVWFVTGTQHLYGPETLKQVAADSTKIAAAFDKNPKIPVKVVFKPILTTPDSITELCTEANTSKIVLV